MEPYVKSQNERRIPADAARWALGLVASIPKTADWRTSIMQVHSVIASACRPCSTYLGEDLSLALDLRFSILLRR